MFNIRSYPQYNRFELCECVICLREFPSPLRYSKRLYSCSDYCENVRNSMVKTKEFYRLCKVLISQFGLWHVILKQSTIVQKYVKV